MRRLIIYSIMFLIVIISPFYAVGQALDQTYIDYYNPLLNGATCDSTTLQAAITAIGVAEKTLYLTATDRNKVACVWNIAASITVPSHIRFKVPYGVTATIQAGQVLTIEGCLDNDDREDWFSGSGSLVATKCVTSADEWLGPAFSNYVQVGGLHTPSGSTTVSVPPTITWIEKANQGTRPLLQRVEDTQPRNITFTSGDGVYWLSMRLDVSVTPGGWTCVGGTFYCWLLNATKPLVPVGTVLLTRSVVSAGAVTEVGDFRVAEAVSGPINLLAPLYGVVGDCATDDTIGIQTTINAAAWQDRNVYAPVSPGLCYSFTRLWFTYDATNNPRFPSALVNFGNYTFYGDGETTTASTVTGPLMNTYFKSTHATGPAFNGASTDMSNPIRNISLHNLSVEANNTTRVIDFTGFNSGVDLHDLYVVQGSATAGGFLCMNCFLLTLRNIFIFNNVNSIGAGLIIRNETPSSGGVIILDNVTVRGWDGTGGKCIILGHTDLTVAALINNIDGRGVQAIECDIGLHIAGGATAGSLSTLHIEGALTTGLWMTHGSRNWTLSSPFFENPTATLADVRIGNEAASSSDEATSGLTMISPWFNSVNVAGVVRETTANVTRTTIINPAMIANATGIGIGFQCSSTPGGVLNGVDIINAGFAAAPSNLATEYVNCEKAGIISDPNFVRVGDGLAIGSNDTVQISQGLHGSGVLDFAVVTANTCTQLTFTVTGAGTADFISPQWPGMGPLNVAQLSWNMYISAADTVAVRACNVSTSNSGDPSSGTFGALVWKKE